MNPTTPERENNMIWPEREARLQAAVIIGGSAVGTAVDASSTETVGDLGPEIGGDYF